MCVMESLATVFDFAGVLDGDDCVNLLVEQLCSHLLSFSKGVIVRQLTVRERTQDPPSVLVVDCP